MLGVAGFQGGIEPGKADGGILLGSPVSARAVRDGHPFADRARFLIRAPVCQAHDEAQEQEARHPFQEMR